MTENSRSPGQALNERYVDVAEREAAVGAREDAVDVREAAMTVKSDGTKALLRDAEERDSLADFRDAQALHRDAAASINDFVSQNQPDTGTLRARGAAALDRTDARDDRAASKKDRSQLTEAEQPELGSEG